MPDSAWGEVPAKALENKVLVVDDDECITELYHPVRNVLFCRIQGHLSESHARALAEASSLETGGEDELHYFCDWDLMQGYASGARRMLTDWGKNERGRLRTGWYICGTRIVEMGVNVAGATMAVLGVRIRAVKRKKFIRELEGHLSE